MLSPEYGTTSTTVGAFLVFLHSFPPPVSYDTGMGHSCGRFAGKPTVNPGVCGFRSCCLQVNPPGMPWQLPKGSGW